MEPTRYVEAGLTLNNAGVSILSSSAWPAKLDYTFSSDRHLLAMYLSKVGGEGSYSEGGDEHDFVPVGPVFFRPANLHLKVRGKAVGGRATRAVHCMLDDRRLQQLNVAGVDWADETLQATLDIRSSQLRSHFLRLMWEISQPSFATPFIADAMLTVMVSDLLNYLSPRDEKHEARLCANDEMVRKIRERICDLHAVTPTVAELADLCGVSDRHLLRLFRERAGMSLIEFIRQARLEKAMELLSSSNLRLKEIAFLLGFQSHASFTTAFGRESGMSPAEFRRAHRRSYRSPKPAEFHSAEDVAEAR